MVSIIVENGNPKYDSRNNCNAILETGTNTLVAGCKNTIIPNSVTSIGVLAFPYISSLTSITIPNSVTHIGWCAFADCGLTSISIPESVTSIEQWAFMGCSNLVSIIVENGNPKYDSRDNCNAIIETATNTLIAGCHNTIIPETVTSIGLGAFDECCNLTSITIPNSVTSIEEAAFYGCTGLTSVTIPNSVTSIGSSAFTLCSSLTLIDIPNSVTNIGACAFFHCSSLTSITIPESVTSINEQAFGYCNNLTDVWSYAEDIPSTGNDLFLNTDIASATLHVPAASIEAYRTTTPWSGFGTIVAIDDTPIITFADANVKALCVANWDTNHDGELSEAEAAAVTDLGEVFKNNTEITSFDELQYFTGLTSICDDAFWGCTGLTSIIIPDRVKTIGERALVNCKGLTSITIPQSVEYIGTGISSCSGLTSIIVDEENSVYDSRNNCNAIIKTEANELIAGCKTTFIPDNITSIAKFAFKHCTGLTSIAIPNSVTSIGMQSFYGCNSLKTITLPGSVNLGTQVFYLCDNLENIYISDIAAWCSSDKTDWIVARDSYPGYNLYVNDVLVNELVFPDLVTSIGEEAFMYCGSINSVVIPNCVSEIKSWAFYECKNLASVTIPNTVTYIGIQTFEGCCSLTSITIPESVTSIGIKAFAECSSLTDVWCYAEDLPTTESDAFNNSPIASATLHVPAASLEAYRTTAPWSSFGTIVPIEEAGIEVTDISQLDNVIYIEPVEARTGTQTTISFKMKNSAEIRSFQFDLVLPEGITAVKNNAGNPRGLLNNVRVPEDEDGIRSHRLTLSEHEGGVIRFLCDAEYGETFIGNEGEIATLMVNVSETMAVGEYPIVMRNVKLSETDISVCYLTETVNSKVTVSSYMLGDINNDGIIDVSDYSGVANHIHGKTPDGFKEKAADVDEDGVIDVSDYSGIANLIHYGSVHGKNTSPANAKINNNVEPQ